MIVNRLASGAEATGGPATITTRIMCHYHDPAILVGCQHRVRPTQHARPEAIELVREHDEIHSAGAERIVKVVVIRVVVASVVRFPGPMRCAEVFVEQGGRSVLVPIRLLVMISHGTSVR